MIHDRVPDESGNAQLYYSDKMKCKLNLTGSDVKSSDRFKTHVSENAERFHGIVKQVLRPGRATLEFFSEVVEPMHGEHKNITWAAVTKRCTALLLGTLLAPVGLVSGIVGKSMEMIIHTNRPFMSVIDNSKGEGVEAAKTLPTLTEDDPLHIRTHNLGFVVNSMSTVGDLRRPKIRAQEVVDSIMSDQMAPDIIFFQEGFNEGATRILCDGIKQKYPHIIYNIAPNISGFNSGQMIASKYPIDSVEYDRLEGMLSPETMSPRGIITATLKTVEGPLKIYSVHTQPLLGTDRAHIRLKQMEQIRAKMDADRKNDPTVKQILVGDFNTSRLDAWGKDNKEGTEGPVLDYLENNFHDPYLDDHDDKTGERLEGKPEFLEYDNKRMGQHLNEAKGSWYVGPFNDPGFIMTAKLWVDRVRHGKKEGAKVVELPQTAKWGTPEWKKEQRADTARFDMVLLNKDSELTARVEARRIITSKQSAPTDHLPVDAKVYFKQKQ